MLSMPSRAHGSIPEAMGLLERFLALDVEIAARRPLAVCALGAVRIELGRETASFVSRVRYRGPVKYSGIHGLTRSDLSDAPDWPAVWRDLEPLLSQVSLVVAYRSSFDRMAVMTMCARHGIRLPRLQFVCAAQLFQEATGRVPRDLASSLAAVDLTFPGQPHEPLADARAAAALVNHLIRVVDGGVGTVIQVSENAASADPARRRRAP